MLYDWDGGGYIETEWFSTKGKGYSGRFAFTGSDADKWAHSHPGGGEGVLTPDGRWGSGSQCVAIKDLKALQSLLKTRTQQFEQLKSQLLSAAPGLGMR